MCRANKIFFHSDLAQMVGKMAVDVNELNIDLASISSHKVGNEAVIIHRWQYVNQQANLNDSRSNNRFFYFF
jgi:Aminotransferase class-V